MFGDQVGPFFGSSSPSKPQNLQPISGLPSIPLSPISGLRHMTAKAFRVKDMAGMPASPRSAREDSSVQPGGALHGVGLPATPTTNTANPLKQTTPRTIALLNICTSLGITTCLGTDAHFWARAVLWGTIWQ